MPFIPRRIFTLEAAGIATLVLSVAALAVVVFSAALLGCFAKLLFQFGG
jgi:hypothetical protein